MTRLINKALTEEPSVSPPILVKSASPLLENGQLGTFQVPEARPLLVAQQLDIGNKKLGNLETWFQKRGGFKTLGIPGIIIRDVSTKEFGELYIDTSSSSSFLFKAVLKTVKTSCCNLSLTTWQHLQDLQAPARGSSWWFPPYGRITGSHGTPYKWPKYNKWVETLCVFFHPLDGNWLFNLET